MTEREAVEKLKNMRLFMQIEDENNDCKFTEDDYKSNEMAIQALENQIATSSELKAYRANAVKYKPTCLGKAYDCGVCHAWIGYYDDSNYCWNCGKKIDWEGAERGEKE